MGGSVHKHYESQICVNLLRLSHSFNLMTPVIQTLISHACASHTPALGQQGWRLSGSLLAHLQFCLMLNFGFGWRGSLAISLSFYLGKRGISKQHSCQLVFGLA